MGWLNARPLPAEGTNRAKTENKAAILTRLEQMKRSGIKPRLPPNPAPHILERLIEIGLTEATGMGSAPLSWLSIEAWQRASRITLPPWEARLIRSLSVEYLASHRISESENCPPPWRDKVVTERQKEAEIENLRSVLG